MGDAAHADIILTSVWVFFSVACDVGNLPKANLFHSLSSNVRVFLKRSFSTSYEALQTVQNVTLTIFGGTQLNTKRLNEGPCIKMICQRMVFLEICGMFFFLSEYFSESWRDQKKFHSGWAFCWAVCYLVHLSDGDMKESHQKTVTIGKFCLLFQFPANVSPWESVDLHNEPIIIYLLQFSEIWGGYKPVVVIHTQTYNVVTAASWCMRAVGWPGVLSLAPRDLYPTPDLQCMSVYPWK